MVQTASLNDWALKPILFGLFLCVKQSVSYDLLWIISAKAAGDVVLRLLFFRILKDLLGAIQFDEFPV